MFDENTGDTGNISDLQKKLMLQIVHETETAVNSAMTMGSVLGIDPREFVRVLVARVISHFFLSVKMANGETAAQTWLEQAMEEVCEHFAHHEVVNLKAVIVRQEAIQLPETSKPAEPTTAAGFTEEEVTLIKRGEWINAIKSIRSRTGLGLREAKEMIDPFRPPRVCSYCAGKGVIRA